MVQCSSNLRQIGASIMTYAFANEQSIFPFYDYGSWKDPSNPSVQIDPYNANAYWGVPYAKFAGAKKEIFNCPAATATDPGLADKGFQAGDIYVCYALNAFDGPIMPDSSRTPVFNSPNWCALFARNAKGVWIGRKTTAWRTPAQLIIAQDAYEATLDGNGDTFNDWYQWAPPNHSPDEYMQWLRHFNAANVLFGDMHVSRLTRQDQSDTRYYTGMW